MEKWWKEQVVYQIYPRSFQDSDGDGVGDIPGILMRLDELRELGVGILWLSPVYSSPDADNGYDIRDYCAIDPRYGTMADMDRLISEAGRRGMKIVMDLVINHTSDEHEWFQKSRDIYSEYRDYYIWRPKKEDGSAPNNWRTFFMEPAWEYDEMSGEYYLHLFHKKQPDLNYRNPMVVEEVKKILRFWLDKGVAGFRCDVINVLWKESFEDGKRGLPVRGLEHYKTREGNHEILRELRRDVLDAYDCFTVGESVMVGLEEAKLLCDEDRKELDMLFSFEHLEVDRRIAKFIPKRFRSSRLLKVLTKWQRGLDWNAVYLENHDQPRIVSHYGDDQRYWQRSAKLLATLQFTLRGTPFLYQGQEIGMTNFDFTAVDQLNDVESHNFDALLKRYHVPAWLRWHWLKDASRDNARTPMQWSADAGTGFTRGIPWLKINGNYRKINYESQKRDPESILAYYKKMIRFREGSETLKNGSFRPVYAKGGVIAYDRERRGETYTAILNFSKKTRRVPFCGDVAVSNTGKSDLYGLLGPFEAVVMKNRSRR